MDVPSLWDSTLELTQDFYDEILKSPVPLNLTALNSLTRSPLAMDIYTWLVYRVFVLKRSGKPFVMIPWAALKEQFGSDYADTGNGLTCFKYNFKLRLKDVLAYYPEAVGAIEDVKSSGCLRLKDCALQIPKF